jgi:hypothetical protein
MVCMLERILLSKEVLSTYTQLPYSYSSMDNSANLFDMFVFDSFGASATCGKSKPVIVRGSFRLQL